MKNLKTRDILVVEVASWVRRETSISEISGRLRVGRLPEPVQLAVALIGSEGWKGTAQERVSLPVAAPDPKLDKRIHQASSPSARVNSPHLLHC